MGATTHSLEVNAPLRAVYNQWTQFEEFPRFMEGVREIRQHGTRTLFWKANIGGKDKEWEAEILEQVPDTRIVWQSVDGTENRGMIVFEPLDPERTRITLTIEYQPEGILEMAGDALGIPSSQVEGDLKRFRDFIEKKEMGTENWRGRVETGESVDATGRPDSANGVPHRENGDRTIDDQGRGTRSISAMTEEASPDPVQTRINTMLLEGSQALHTTETKTEFLPKAPGANTEEAAESSSQFYRDAGVLAPTHEAIALRAYELYLARGRTDGHAREDWLEAERQLAEATLEQRPEL
jgi:uncharacterized protein YndB with AHSA1/START domain